MVVSPGLGIKISAATVRPGAYVLNTAARNNNSPAVLPQFKALARRLVCAIFFFNKGSYGKRPVRGEHVDIIACGPAPDKLF